MERRLVLVGFLLFTLLVLDSPDECSAQFWSRIRDAIRGRRDDGGPTSTQPPSTSRCDKGESYKPDGCNTCYCVGSRYRCTLKYCDESLSSLPAFQFDK